jgi:hypothetical protein
MRRREFITLVSAVLALRRAGARDGSIIATIITTHTQRAVAAAPGHVCPGVRMPPSRTALDSFRADVTQSPVASPQAKAFAGNE